mgnify:FL=1
MGAGYKKASGILHLAAENTSPADAHAVCRGRAIYDLGLNTTNDWSRVNCKKCFSTGLYKKLKESALKKIN